MITVGADYQKWQEITIIMLAESADIFLPCRFFGVQCDIAGPSLK